MVDNNEDKTTQESDIQNYFHGRCVFLTGATGFLGMLLLEKLLRTCTGIKKVFILVRPKNNKSEVDRLNGIVKNEIFYNIRKINPKFEEKIVLLAGDCMLPDLGLNEDAKQMIINEVNCIFHCAATVRFNEKLRIAVCTNIRSIRDLINIAKEMKHLKAFIHVSTAYSNCIREEVGEEFYEYPYTGEQLIAIANNLGENMLKTIQPILMGKWPNTYTFTKACAEEVIRSQSKGIPIAIVRPSIVLATANEPTAGWSNQLYGAIGVIIGIASGRIRILNGNNANVADLVPADYLVNCIISAAWKVGTTPQYNNRKRGKYSNRTQVYDDKEIKGGGTISNETDQNVTEDETNQVASDIPIFNYVSYTAMPITWGAAFCYTKRHYRNVTSCSKVWNCLLVASPNYFIYATSKFLLHTIPANAVDFLGRLLGKNFRLAETYRKFNKLIDTVAYFPKREWRFQNNNTQALWRTLNAEDKKLYNFDLSNIDWNSYFYTFVTGTRKYLLNKPAVALPPTGTNNMFKLVAYIAAILMLLSILLFLYC